MLNKQGPGKIDYCDYTWTPITGCLHGCEYCYARSIYKRFGKSFEPELHMERLNDIDKLKKPSKIFVCSTADLFGEWVPAQWIHLVLDKIKQHPEHTFLLLTKNPKRYASFEFPENCWLGTTADGLDKTRFNIRDLNDSAKNNLRWVSFEPVLGEISTEELRAMLFNVQWITLGVDSRRGSKAPKSAWLFEIYGVAKCGGTAVWIKDNCFLSKMRHYACKDFPHIYGKKVF